MSKRCPDCHCEKPPTTGCPHSWCECNHEETFSDEVAISRRGGHTSTKKPLIAFLILILVAVGVYYALPRTPDPSLGASVGKGQKIVAAVQKGKYLRSKYDIEIVDIRPIENGVEVFARVWDGQGQIGFGKDGTVDIERFRLINPPVIVRDPDGDIINDYIDEDGNLITSRGREDPKEALLHRLEGALDAKKQKHSSDKIIKGKIGNTTTVVDYNIGAGSAGDSAYLNIDGAVDYATARDGATADSVINLTTNALHNILHNSQGGSSEFYVRRADIQFDTSAIGDTDTIDSASITVNVGEASTVNSDTDTVVLLNNTDNGNISDPLVTEDMNDFTSTSIGSKTLALMDSEGNQSISLTDFVAINKTGNTRIGIRMLKDIDNDSPVGFNVLRIQTGSSGDDPFLTVEHAAPSATEDASYLIFFE